VIATCANLPLDIADASRKMRRRPRNSLARENEKEGA
jgi:hypothetical protein